MYIPIAISVAVIYTINKTVVMLSLFMYSSFNYQIKTDKQQHYDDNI